jgi:ribosomal protein S27E
MVAVSIPSTKEGKHMQKINCPGCGHETVAGASCSDCGHTAVNSSATSAKTTPPAEVASWAIEHASPDVLAWARQTFSEVEFLAAKREIEQGGGHRFEDFIDEIERIAHGKE